MKVYLEVYSDKTTIKNRLVALSENNYEVCYKRTMAFKENEEVFVYHKYDPICGLGFDEINIKCDVEDSVLDKLMTRRNPHCKMFLKGEQVLF